MVDMGRDSSPGGDTIILVDLAKRIVQVVAPEELDLFENSPSSIGSEASVNDGPLAFGVDLPDQFITTLIISFLTTFFAESAKATVSGAVVLLKDAFSKRELSSTELLSFLQKRGVDKALAEKASREILLAIGEASLKTNENPLAG